MAIFKLGVQYNNHQFLMVLTSDHVSGATVAITGAAPVVKLGKNGATAVTSTFSPATEVDPTNLPGIYSISLSTTDLNALGDLVLHATAPSADPTDEVHQVQNQIFTDLVLDGNNRAMISSAVRQNTTFYLPFIMTVAGVPTPSLSGFTAQRAFAGAGFAPCVNTVAEVGGPGLGAGWYGILLPPADTNAAVIEFHITASGADDRNITLYTQP